MNNLKRELRNLVWKLFLKLENNNNVDFNRNGEKFFIEKMFYILSKKTKDEIVIFDIGANIGDYTKILLNELTKYDFKVEIHLFEPTKSCFDELVRRYSNFSSISLNNFGASSKNGKSIIYYDQEKSGLASLYNRNLEAYHLVLEKTEYVDLRKLSNYIEEKKLHILILLKLILRGMSSKPLKALSVIWILVLLTIYSLNMEG
ncbi:FkbM family methyltransferase [Acinetobacter brisouii]